MSNYKIFKESCKDLSLHELEVIRENLLRELCDIVRFSIKARKKATKKLDEVLYLNDILNIKEYNMTLDKIKKVKK